MADLLKGKPVADAYRERLAARLAALAARGHVPGLALVRWGADAVAKMYADFMEKKAREAGLYVRRVEAVDLDEAAAEAAIRQLNEDAQIDGVLILMPLPKQLDREKIINLLNPDKDIDGLTPTQAGRLATGRRAFVPATARACLAILDHYGIEIEGRRAVVIGRSDVIGKPVARLLLARNATVTVCHSRTRDLAAVARTGEILVAAVGKMEMIGADMVAPGATVVDVGIHRDGNRTRGDVAADAAAVAGAITPVPGGVGTVTTTMLLDAVVTACEQNHA